MDTHNKILKGDFGNESMNKAIKNNFLTETAFCKGYGTLVSVLRGKILQASRI